MQRRSLVLGWLVVHVATPWIAAALVSNGTEKVEEGSTTQNVDDTRRESAHFSMDQNIYPFSTIDKDHEENNLTEELVSRSFNTPKEELTGFEMEAPCDNAQFLMKILTVLLPLLRNEVPTSTRTSYILYVLKDLLKSSPEAAQDYEIMYKINDLLLTLEKYHDDRDKYSLDLGHSALRQLDSVASVPRGVRSKVVFQYEVPQLENPDCTAELLTIIKIVQQSILRLVNNPLCKSRVPLDSPILVDVKDYLNNPNINFREDMQQMPLNPMIDTNILDEVTINNQKPFSYIPENPNPDSNKKYDQLPFEQKPHNWYPEHATKKPAEYPYYYGASPNELSILDGEIINPEYFPLGPEQHYDSTPILDIPIEPWVKQVNNEKSFDYLPSDDIELLRPKTNPKIMPFNPNVIDSSGYRPSFDLFGDGSGEFEIKNNKPFSVHDVEIPSDQEDVEITYLKPLPLDVYGDDDSTEIQFGSYNSDQPNKKPKPLKPENIYIPYNSDVFTIPNQSPEENPNKYDSSPQGKPIDKGPFNLPKEKLKLPPHPHNSPNRGNNKPRPYNPYLPNIEFIEPKKFDIFGGGSGEIQLGPLGTPITKYIVAPVESKPKPDYYEPYDTNDLPKYYWPEDNADENNVIPEAIPDFYIPNQENIIVPEQSTKRPLNDDRQYIIPEITIPFEEIPDSGNLNAGYDIPQKNEPRHPYNVPNEISSQPILVPETQILQIIRENIDILEQKIPREYLNLVIREMIRRLKELLNTEQITIETYVNIINQYQILIDYVKNLNISNEIMKELLLSMTNLDKLDLQTGKSQVIELTYLVKRPKPLVYQPYYYIKYQLPYTSFLTRMERLLTLNPYFKNNPSQLYKALISISKVTETSPDLVNYGKEDIIKLTFNKGTLVGAKVVKETDADMFNTLENLNRINTDLSIDEVYELIKNLNAQLKRTDEGLVIKNSNIPELNINSQPDTIRVIQVGNQPILQKVTRITTKKVADNQILADLLNNINVLRSNMSEDLKGNSSQPQLDNNTDKVNGTVFTEPLIERTRNVDDLDDLDNGIPLFEYDTAKNKLEINSLKNQKNNKFNIYKDSKYYSENNEDRSFGLKTKQSNIDFDFKGLYSNPTLYDKMPGSVKETEWIGGTNKYYKKPEDVNQKLISIDYLPLKTVKSNSYKAGYLELQNPLDVIPQQRLLPITSVNQLDASLNLGNNKHDEILQRQNLESGPSIINNDIIKNPKVIESHLLTHSKTYIDNVPVEHSKTYLVEKPYNDVQQSETSYSNPIKYDVKNSIPLVDNSLDLNDNPSVANNNFLSQSQRSNLEKLLGVATITSAKYNALKSLSQGNNLLNLNSNPYVPNNNYLSQAHATNLDIISEVPNVNLAKYDVTKYLSQGKNPLTLKSNPSASSNNYQSQSQATNLDLLSEVPNVNSAKYVATKYVTQDKHPLNFNSNPYVANNNYLSQSHATYLDSKVPNVNSAKYDATKYLSQDKNSLTFDSNPYITNDNYLSHSQATNLDVLSKVPNVNSAKYDVTKDVYQDSNPLTLESNPYVGYNNYISQSFDNDIDRISGVPNINSAKYAMTKTLSKNNLYSNNNNLAGSPNWLANALHYQTHGGNNLLQNPAYLGGNLQVGSQQFGMNNVGNFGVYNQNLLRNNMNGGFRYLIQKKMPFLYQFRHSPRLVTRPVLG